ncbi:hypothetical protein OFAG_02223 [Oxalobacter formigenes HOxBLS]|uniref:Uncharacterized protein n=1 Tax=Oxalobacter paraformigenes TaxID=556268 RepID=T5LPT0_9BURK|nr:hypothetical protein OFAG_02223 [Oxalobacter paraformigenes]
MTTRREGFNPRTREGATQELDRMTTRREVSIHAPVRVRRDGWSVEQESTMFQSTHP